MNIFIVFLLTTLFTLLGEVAISSFLKKRHLPFTGLLLLFLAAPVYYVYQFDYRYYVAILSFFYVFLIIKYLPKDYISYILKYLKDNVWEVFLVIFTSIIYLALSYKFFIAPGADSAVHAFLVQSPLLEHTYPQAIHIILNTFVASFGFHASEVLLGFSVVLASLYLTLSFNLFKTVGIKGTRLYWPLVIATVLNPGFHNNLVNGSYSHALAYLFVIMGIIWSFKTIKNQNPITYFYLFLLLLFSFYAHTISFVTLLVLIFLGKVLTKSGFDIKISLIISGVLLIGIPLDLYLVKMSFYSLFIFGAVGIWLLFELINIVEKKYGVVSFLTSKYFLLVWAATVILFLVTFIYFKPVYTWYSITGSVLAVLGLLSFYKELKSIDVFSKYILLFFLGVLIVYVGSLFLLGISGFSVLRNLIYYYFLLLPIIFFGGYGISILLGRLPWRLGSIVTVLLIILTLVVQFGRLDLGVKYLRVFDKYLSAKFISYDGFGVFSNKSDVEVFAYIKENINPDDTVLVLWNPHNIWASVEISDWTDFKGTTNISPQYTYVRSYVANSTLNFDDLTRQYGKIGYIVITGSTSNQRIVSEKYIFKPIYVSGKSILYRLGTK